MYLKILISLQYEYCPSESSFQAAFRKQVSTMYCTCIAFDLQPKHWKSCSWFCSFNLHSWSSSGPKALHRSVNIFGNGEIARQSEDTPTVYRHQKTWHWNWWSRIACMSFYYVGAVLMLDARLYDMWTISSAKALSARSTCCGSCGREEVKWSYRSNTTFWSGTGYELFLLLGHGGHCSLSIQKALSGPAAIVGCLPRPARQPGQVPDYSDNKNPINEHRHSIA